MTELQWAFALHWFVWLRSATTQEGADEVKCRWTETDSNMWPNQFGGVTKEQEIVRRAEWGQRSKRCHCSRLHLHRSECCLVLCCDIEHTDEELLFHMHKCQNKQPKTNEKLLLWWAELLLAQPINQRQFSASDIHCQSTTMNWLEQQSTDDVQINDCNDTQVNFGKGSDSLSYWRLSLNGESLSLTNFFSSNCNSAIKQSKISESKSMINARANLIGGRNEHLYTIVRSTSETTPVSLFSKLLRWKFIEFDEKFSIAKWWLIRDESQWWDFWLKSWERDTVLICGIFSHGRQGDERYQKWETISFLALCWSLVDQ